MKTNKFTLLLMIMIMMLTTASARIIRVNNTPGADANFTTIGDALSYWETADGDTIYIESSSISYAGFTTDKQIVYIGPGYFLDENPQTQANLAPAKISSSVTLSSGASGSVITGLHFTFAVTIQDDDIVLKRNRFYGSYALNIANDVQNIIIKNNYFSTNLTINSNCQNIIISNNCFIRSSASSGTIQAASSAALRIDHNVIFGMVTAYNSVFSNNIVIEGTGWTLENNTYYNNITNDAQCGITQNGYHHISMDDMFVGETGNSTDGQYQLKAGSPALGADTEGGDCGMFGGLSPYVLSGIPALPAIYDFYSTNEASNTTGLRIEVKAKTND